jgi:membrane associated rhomboid family serine protease
MLKKVIRWTPFVSIALLVLMFVGMTQADCIQEGVHNYCDSELWTADAESFSIADVLALFGHGNGLHFFGNALALLLFTVPAELLLGRKKFVPSIILIMVIQVIIGELTRTEGLGSSGWLMATPGLMFGASMWRIWKEDESIHSMAFPVIFFGVAIAMTAIDLASLGSDSGVDHMAHISGFLTGLLFVVAGIPFLVMTIREEIRAWQRKRAWKKRMALA